jgi:hypothetical protein
MAAAFGHGGLSTGRAAAHLLSGPRPRRCGLPRSGLRPKRPDWLTLAGAGAPVDGTRQGSWRKHHYSAVKVLGKRNGGGAHPSGGSTSGGETAPVSGGALMGGGVAGDALEPRRKSTAQWGFRSVAGMVPF